MKKRVVNESLHEFIEENNLNEGFFSSLSSFMKKALTKLGDLIVFKSPSKKEFMSVIAPVNIGILKMKGKLPDHISYRPSANDVELVPELGDFKINDFMQIGKFKQWLEKQKKKLQKESLNEARYEEGEIEQEMPEDHPSYKDVTNVGREMFIDYLEDAIENPTEVKLLVWGAPGIGKTAIANQIAANYEGRVIGVDLSAMIPDDWDLPTIRKKGEGSETGEELEAVELPKTWLPVYKPTGDKERDEELDEIANQGNGGILFLDELTRASEGVLSSCLTLIQERTIKEFRLGSKWVVVAAANRASDEPNLDDIQELGSALGDRFEQVNYILEFDEWKEYAMSKGVRQEIIDFLDFNREYFYKFRAGSTLGATPRSWENASKKLSRFYERAKRKGKEVTKDKLTTVLASNVSVPIAREVANFLKMLEDYDSEDFRKPYEDPQNAPLPPQKGSGYELSEAHNFLSVVIKSYSDKQLTPKQFENFCKYLVRLNNESLASSAFTMLIDEYHPYLHEGIDPHGDQEYKAGLDTFVNKYGDDQIPAEG